MDVINSRVDIRDGYFDTVFELAQTNQDLVFLSADADAHSLVQFRKAYPDRYINVGVAEQNMITVATGLALAGKRVFVYSLLPFLAMRCYEQIHFNIVGMNLPVSFVGVGAGYSFDFDGPSHHGVIDIGLFNLLSGFTIFNPSDSDTAKSCARFSFSNNGPTLTRLDKGRYDCISTNSDFSKGFRIIRKPKSNIKIIVTGVITHKVIELVDNISRIGIEIEVVEIFRIKPINTEGLHEILQEGKLIFCIEENSQGGGLKSVLNDVIMEYSLSVKLVPISLSDKPCFTSGSRESLLTGAGLSIDQLTSKITIEVRKFQA